MTDDFQRYLRAKRTVDDRSLDRRLLDRLREGLADRAADRDSLAVLEVGAGVGTMVERMLAWDLLPPGETTYTAVDVDPDNVAALPDRLVSWAADRPVEARRDGDGVVLADGNRTVTVRPVTAEASSFVADADGSWDLLVGMAFLDIVAAEQLPTLLSALAPGGYWYFPITFDGGTRFVPAHPADEEIERAYHAHMDAKPDGASRAGEASLARLLADDAASVEGVAGSDWAVYPDGDGYPGDEAYFLRYILATVESSLADRDDIPDDRVADWLATRRQQVGSATLAYLTHQLDLFGRRV